MVIANPTRRAKAARIIFVRLSSIFHLLFEWHILPWTVFLYRTYTVPLLCLSKQKMSLVLNLIQAEINPAEGLINQCKLWWDNYLEGQSVVRRSIQLSYGR